MMVPMEVWWVFAGFVSGMLAAEVLEVALQNYEEKILDRLSARALRRES